MGGVIAIVVVSCAVGILWAIWNYLQIKKISIGSSSTGLYENVVDNNDEVPEEQRKVIN